MSDGRPVSQGVCPSLHSSSEINVLRAVNWLNRFDSFRFGKVLINFCSYLFEPDQFWTKSVRFVSVAKFEIAPFIFVDYGKACVVLLRYCEVLDKACSFFFDTAMAWLFFSACFDLAEFWTKPVRFVSIPNFCQDQRFVSLSFRYHWIFKWSNLNNDDINVVRSTL
jgi:hypothetical protein